MGVTYAENRGREGTHRIVNIIKYERSWDIAVGRATRYGLDGPGIDPGRDEVFCTRPDRPWGPPSLLYNGYRVFPGGKAVGTWR